MAMPPSISEDAEQVDDALAGAGQETKPFLVTGKATEALERDAETSRPPDRYLDAHIPEGMKPFLVPGKATEDSLKRHLEPPDPADEALAGAGQETKPFLVTGKATEALERDAETSRPPDRYLDAHIPEGMKPFLVPGKATEDSLRRNVKPAEQKDRKTMADRFSSWLRQWRSRRAATSR